MGEWHTERNSIKRKFCVIGRKASGQMLLEKCPVARIYFVIETYKYLYFNSLSKEVDTVRKIWSLLFVLSIPFTLAQTEEAPSNFTVNLTNSALGPLFELINPVIVKLSVLVGGIFGLYVILIILRVHYERKNMKLLQHIRYNLDQQNQYYGIPSSQEKRGFVHAHILDKLFPFHVKRHYQPFPSKKEKRS